RYVNHRCSDHCKAQPSQAGFNAHEAPRPKFFLSIHHPGLGNSDGTRAATTLSPGLSNSPLSKRRLGNVRFFAPLVGGLSGRRSARRLCSCPLEIARLRRSTNVHCEQLFAPPAAFDFVARLRWRIYAAVVRRPATLATRQRPLLACCHYRDGVSGPISTFHRSCELREFQHNVAPTCQGLPSKSTRVARPRLSLDRLAGADKLAGAASAHSRLGTMSTVESTLELLRERFPKCFVRYPQPRQPLKIGVHKDLAVVLAGVVSRSEIGRAL